jgi:hypothetical protein
MLWDVFISHASEDKEDVARPLAALLHDRGLRVWLDEQQLVLGDSLSQKINDGLAFSRFGILVLSKRFLEKDYPQKEMQALLARQSANERYILPILHKVDHSLLLRRLPLLGDLLSISTDNGLEQVAGAVQRAVASLSLEPSPTAGRRYFDQFDFPANLITDAVAGISSLCNPATWRQLSPTRDMLAPDTWMGTDTTEFIELLFALYAPIAHFANHRYRLERTLTSLRACDRVRFVLLDAALEALTKDSSIAATIPRLPYSPRVPAWRQKRSTEPDRYWWQGLTLERLKSAVPTFYDSTSNDAMPSAASFQQAYSVGYRAFCGGQQTLGLLANPLYGFTPRTRPIYRRMISIWQRLYTSILQLPSDATSLQLLRLFVDAPWVEATLPVHSLGLDLLPEAADSTRDAVCAYCKTYIEPKLREQLG